MGKPNSRAGSTSRVARKWEKKVRLFCKFRDAIDALNAKRDIDKKRISSQRKKLTVYDLSALSEFLPDLKPPSQSTSAPPSTPPVPMIEEQQRHLMDDAHYEDLLEELRAMKLIIALNEEEIQINEEYMKRVNELLQDQSFLEPPSSDSDSG